MKEQLRVEHPRVSLTEVEAIVNNREMPVQRSPHIGNQNAAELCLQAYMPPGISVMAVDTIRGSDNYSSPRCLLLQGGLNIPLAAGKVSGRVVGSVVIRDDIEKYATRELIDFFGLEPGKPIMDVHQESLQRMQAPNIPVPMMDYFMGVPDILSAVMVAASDVQSVTREVAPDGKIIPTTRQDVSSVFGVDDTTPKNQGAMIPLNAMMATDVLIVIAKGATTSLHLGGPDMIRYTRDMERMAEVSTLIGRALSLMEAQAETHCLKIADMTRFGDTLDADRHVSQHAMLVADRVDILGTAVEYRQKVRI